MSNENRLLLPDGRTLAYAEFGRPDGAHLSTLCNHFDEIARALVRQPRESDTQMV